MTEDRLARRDGVARTPWLWGDPLTLAHPPGWRRLALPRRPLRRWAVAGVGLLLFLGGFLASTGVWFLCNDAASCCTPILIIVAFGLLFGGLHVLTDTDFLFGDRGQLPPATPEDALALQPWERYG